METFYSERSSFPGRVGPVSVVTPPSSSNEQQQSSYPSGNSESLATTVLATNIHCASCVTHIEDILGRLGPGILHVSVSIVSNEVHILHASDIGPKTLCKILADEAFEVFSATTVDKDDRVVVEQVFAPASDGWLDSPGNGLWRSSRYSSGASESCLQAPTRTKRKKHLENCATCRAKEVGQSARNKLSFHKDLKLESDIQGQRDLDTREEKKAGLPAQQHKEKRPTPDSAIHQNSDDQQSPADSTAGQINSGEENQPTSGRWRLLLSVEGMTCASCTSAVTRAVRELGQVNDVSVDLMSNSASIQYEGLKAFSNDLVESIEDLGYEAVIAELELQPGLSANTESTSPSTSLYRAILSVGGMTCVACSNAITKALEELPFVKEVTISALTHSGVVLFEDSSNLDGIIERVEDLGYDCSVESCKAETTTTESDKSSRPSPLRTIQIRVDGMFCEHCPARIIEALKSNFASAITIDKAPTLKNPVMVLTYRPLVPRFTIREILLVINSSNKEFAASILHPPSIEERSKKMQIHERKRLLHRLALCTVIAIPTFLIGIVWMDLVPETNSQRIYFMSPTWSGSVTRGDWAMFILATPVFFLAADVFHLRALKEIRALWRPGSKVPILRRFYRFGSMNLLISAGTTVAYVSSLAMLIINATKTDGNSNSTTYFDSVVFLTFFILIGRFLEAFSKSKTGDAVSMLGKLRPQEAMLVVPMAVPESGDRDHTDPTKARLVGTDLLEAGDSVIVAHGSSPPADGVITVGQGKFDESSLTGEARVVHKTLGEKVYAGTINTGHPVTVEITEIGGTSMLDQIVYVVREGLSKRAPVERVADMITGYFVPVISGLAIITFVVWVALGYSHALDPKYLGNATGGWVFWSLEFAIAVFVVACPCGIGLAAPTALFVGIGLAAKHGILVRGGGEAFQEASEPLDAIVFDKTGTLTEGGEVKVTEYEMLNDEDQKTAWAIITKLEEQSAHPIAQAILGFSSDKPQNSIDSLSIGEVPGLGMRGTFTGNVIDGRPPVTYEAAIGSQALIESLNSTLVSQNTYASQLLYAWQNQSKSIAILALRRLSTDADTSAFPALDPRPAPWILAAVFGTSDPVRPSSLPTIHSLRARGIAVYMLSGDNPTTAAAVGTSLGIPHDHIFAGVLPTEKAAKIKHLQQTLPRRSSPSKYHSPLLDRLFTRRLETNTPDQHPSRTSRSPARVAFVGDGINDAPALLAATLSISLSSGSPIALTSSSFVLLSPSLAAIPTLLDLSARVFRRVKFNYGWALVYNAVLVPVAAGVLFRVRDEGWRLGPVWAAAAMAGSSVSVVASSLALRVEVLHGGARWWRNARAGEAGGQAEAQS